MTSDENDVYHAVHDIFQQNIDGYVQIATC